MTDILEIEARCASLKEKLGKKVAIVGHHYQKDSVIKFCDHVGDSLELIQKIPALDARYIIFCGVSFMGETAAMLAREDQKILLPAAASSPRTVNMPSAAQLQDGRPWLVGRPWLLPVAWAQRVGRLLFDSKWSRITLSSLKEARQRLKLLRRYGLLTGKRDNERVSKEVTP